MPLFVIDIRDAAIQDSMSPISLLLTASYCPDETDAWLRLGEREAFPCVFLDIDLADLAIDDSSYTDYSELWCSATKMVAIV